VSFLLLFTPPLEVGVVQHHHPWKFGVVMATSFSCKGLTWLFLTGCAVFGNGCPFLAGCPGPFWKAALGLVFGELRLCLTAVGLDSAAGTVSHHSLSEFCHVLSEVCAGSCFRQGTLGLVFDRLRLCSTVVGLDCTVGVKGVTAYA